MGGKGDLGSPITRFRGDYPHPPATNDLPIFWKKNPISHHNPLPLPSLSLSPLSPSNAHLADDVLRIIQLSNLVSKVVPRIGKGERETIEAWLVLVRHWLSRSRREEQTISLAKMTGGRTTTTSSALSQPFAVLARSRPRTKNLSIIVGPLLAVILFLLNQWYLLRWETSYQANHDIRNSHLASIHHDSRRNVRGFIVDVDYFLQTLPESGRPPVMETAFLSQSHMDFERVYNTLKSIYPSPNAGVQQQHLSQVLLAATLHQSFGFEIVTNEKMLKNDISKDDMVMLFWGNSEHWTLDATTHPDPKIRITGGTMKAGLGKLNSFFDKYSNTWMAPGGENLIWTASFPRYFFIRRKHVTKATFVITEEGMVYRKLLKTANIHIIPYSLVREATTAEPLSNGQQDNGVLQEPTRSTFLMMRAGCDANGTYGKRMRHDIVQILTSSNLNTSQFPGSIDAQCESSNDDGARQEGHEGYVRRLKDSIFCLIPPGDTSASLRLVEAMVHGCVPVLLGPPFHTIFLADLWDWSNLAVPMYVHNQTWVASRDGGRPVYPRSSFLANGFIESIEQLELFPKRLVDVYHGRYQRLKRFVDKKRKELQVPHSDDNQSFPVPAYMHALAKAIILEFAEKEAMR